MSPLTSEHLKKLENKLLEEKEDIKSQLQTLDFHDFGNDTEHLEEETDETEEFSNRLGVKLALENRLEKIEKALTKIKAGNYGRCEKCQSEISFPLLEVDPESELCQKCKTRSR